jgi:hypothetical protein
MTKSRFLSAAMALACVARAQNAVPVPAAGNVTMPLDEYNQLVEKAAQIPKPAAEPPFPQLLKRAQMNLQVTGESVSGTVAIEGQVLARGDRMVPLMHGLIVRQASQQSAAGQQPRNLPVEQQNGTLSALLSGPGEFAVTLDAAVPLLLEPGKASFNLPAPSAGAVRATLSIPGEETQVNLSPGLITSRTSRGGRTIIEATLIPGQTANVWWASRLSLPEAPAPPKEVRFLSDVKTLITVGEGELSIAALAEITVVQGEPVQFTVHAPDGYELTGATGATLTSSETKTGVIVLKIASPATRSHQFLISMARASTAPAAEIPLLSFEGTQRETGEVLVEGEGAMELTATERGVLRRMDLKEVSPYLRSMARGTLHTAFRYQKKPGETPSVALEWVRFPNSKLLAAIAQQAVVTTLVTSEGRSLTEVKLTLKNQSQPFLKVDLPAGASILSADVGGEKVKPLQGSDGDRVPLLRPGFRPTDTYTVSFVFVHAGAPFAKKGGAELALPRIDLPIARIEWEVFLPQQYKVADFGGDALLARLLPFSGTNERIVAPVDYSSLGSLSPSSVGGVVSDQAGAAIAGARVELRNQETGVVWTAVTDRSGQWSVPGIPSGRFMLTCSSPGFKTYSHTSVYHDANRATREDITLQVGSAAESVTVTAESSLLRTESAELSRNVTKDQLDQLPLLPPSANVTDLQRRVSGVLPIAVNVPREGNSYRFVRVLAVDEETKLSFRYRTK